MNYDKMQKNFYWITIKCNKSSLQIRYFASLLRGKASERRHARSAINTTQADRRSVVQAMRMHYEHLEVMRQASATSLSPRIAENALQTEFTGYRLPVIVNNAAQSSFSAQGGPPPALGSAPVYDALKWNFFSPHQILHHTLPIFILSLFAKVQHLASEFVHITFVGAVVN